MTKEALAALLNGRSYRHEITREEAAEAAANRLVVIFGASDDLCELRGAIDDELGAYREALVCITRDGTLLHEVDDDDIDVLKKYDVLGVALKAREVAIRVSARWCASDEYSWTYETTQPHATFDIVDDDRKYCRGIVIDLREETP